MMNDINDSRAFTIKGISRELLSRIRAGAGVSGRSMNSYLLMVLEAGVPVLPFPGARGEGVEKRVDTPSLGAVVPNIRMGGGGDGSGGTGGVAFPAGGYFAPPAPSGRTAGPVEPVTEVPGSAVQENLNSSLPAGGEHAPGSSTAPGLKGVEDFLRERREITEVDEFKRWKAEVKGASHLSAKQKEFILYNNPGGIEG